MRRIQIIFIKRRIAYIVVLAAFAGVLLNIFLLVKFLIFPVNTFIDQNTGIIVIDPGHGGVDGGTNIGGILEKDINLDIGKRLKLVLEKKGYKVVMTREEDVSLDKLNKSSSSRHKRDLIARTGVVNNSGAQLFISIHVNCNLKVPSSSGAIVFYSEKFAQNKVLAYFVQRALNDMELSGRKRTVHDPVRASYYVLNYAHIPGIIVETAFISNKEERQELIKESFREEIAEAIAAGAERYLYSRP